MHRRLIAYEQTVYFGPYCAISRTLTDTALRARYHRSHAILRQNGQNQRTRCAYLLNGELRILVCDNVHKPIALTITTGILGQPYRRC